jgi:hypothetical protein
VPVFVKRDVPCSLPHELLATHGPFHIKVPGAWRALLGLEERIARLPLSVAGLSLTGPLAVRTGLAAGVLFEAH